MRGVVLPLAALALALSTLGVLGGPERWELDLALWRGEPWRLVTGHLVHWSAGHLAWDLAVFVGLGAPLLTPGLTVYRGLSGLDSALFALLAARCLRSKAPRARIAGAAALVALAGKIGWELTTGAPLFVPETAGVAVVPAAHLCGGIAGVLAGLSTGLPMKPRPRVRVPRLTTRTEAGTIPEWTPPEPSGLRRSRSRSRVRVP